MFSRFSAKVSWNFSSIIISIDIVIRNLKHKLLSITMDKNDIIVKWVIIFKPIQFDIYWVRPFLYYERYQRILVREEIPSHALWQGTPAVISLTIKSHIQNKCEEVQENWTVLFWGISISIWTQNVKFHDLIYQRNWISTKTALIRIVMYIEAKWAHTTF